MILKAKSYNLKANAGQAALSLVLLIGGIAVLASVISAFLAASFIRVSFGFEAAERALTLASAGADDGILKLVRNKSFSDAAGYTVPLGNNAATVTVTQNSPAPGQATIISTAAVGLYRRKVRVVASIDAITGQVRVVSRESLTI